MVSIKNTYSWLVGIYYKKYNYYCYVFDVLRVCVTIFKNKKHSPPIDIFGINADNNFNISIVLQKGCDE